MIPVCMSEIARYKDDDGTVWEFKPRTGALEREWYLDVRNPESKDRTEQQILDSLGSFVDKIVIGWTGKPTGTPCDLLNMSEKYTVVDYWMKSGALTVEEKKV